MEHAIGRGGARTVAAFNAIFEDQETSGRSRSRLLYDWAWDIRRRTPSIRNPSIEQTWEGGRAIVRIYRIIKSNPAVPHALPHYERLARIPAHEIGAQTKGGSIENEYWDENVVHPTPRSTAHFIGAPRLGGKFARRPIVNAPRGGEVDENEAEELYQFILNDADLYRQQFEPIVKNLDRKRAKGIYDSELSVKLWMYLVDNAARKYIRESSGSTGMRIDEVFTRPTRLSVARQLRDDYEAETGARGNVVIPRSRLGARGPPVTPAPRATRARRNPGEPRIILVNAKRNQGPKLQPNTPQWMQLGLLSMTSFNDLDGLLVANDLADNQDRWDAFIFDRIEVAPMTKLRDLPDYYNVDTLYVMTRKGNLAWFKERCKEHGPWHVDEFGWCGRSPEGDWRAEGPIDRFMDDERDFQRAFGGGDLGADGRLLRIWWD